MAYTTINKSSLHFNTKLYTGNGSNGHAITGVGFQPDMTWLKNRDTTNDHELFDAVRGATKTIYPNRTDAEYTNATGSLTSFNSDGFTVGNGDGANKNSSGIAAWNWKANGAGSSNTDGNGITSTVSVNTTSGFSIVKYTGTGSASATIGHGLGIKPAMVIIRPLGYSGAWWIAHKNLSTDEVLEFNTNAQAPISGFGGGGLKYSTFTTSVIGGGNGSSNSDLWNKSGENYIAYCFAEKTGYSKIGSFVSNGNNDGAFIYTGFKSSFILLKKSSGSGTDWYIFNNKSPGYNDNNKSLRANTSATEASASGYSMDILSNGFKIRTSNTALGESGATYIYYAVGQSIVGTNNIPANAR